MTNEQLHLPIYEPMSCEGWGWIHVRHEDTVNGHEAGQG